MNVCGFVWNMFKVGLIGFGGGSALIPVIDRVVVKKLGDEENYCRDVVVASITPGALPVELASGLGRRNFGRLGMFFGALAMAFPGVLLSIIIYSSLLCMHENSVSDGLEIVFRIISIGITLYILYLLIKYIINAIFRQSDNMYRIWCVVVMLAVAVPVCMKLISTISVLLLFFVIMIIWSFFRKKESSDATFKFHLNVRAMAGDIAIWFLFVIFLTVPTVILSVREMLLMQSTGTFLLNGLISSFLSFGGGDAYLSIADGFFVQSNLIPESDFYGKVVSVVNMLPGSILCKTLSSVGFYMGLNNGGYVAGLVFALAGFACSIAGSCISFGVAGYLYDSFGESMFVQAVNRWIRPVICGLLISVMVSLVKHTIMIQ